MRRTVIVPKAKAVRKVSNNDWETKMDEVEVSRDQIHRMIMDYFVVEGYASAATAFSKESNCAETSSPQKKTLSERSSVICAMNEGDCSTAIALTNKINPDVLEEDPSVAFAVALQQLIELIREKELDECLDFAHEEIVSRCEDNDEFREELERVMTLLVFPGQDSPVAGLLEESERRKVSSLLNRAILTAEGVESESKLHELLRTLQEAQREVKKQSSSIGNTSPFPLIDDVTTATLSGDR